VIPLSVLVEQSFFFIPFFFLINCVHVFTTFILTQWCYSVVLCMSLLDSACRIGHRKYLLNELIMRPTNIHDTFQTPISSPENGRIRGSVDPWMHRFRGASNPRMPVLLGIPGFADRSIPGCSDFPKPKIPETSNSRISGTLSLSVLGFGRSMIENSWVLTFRNNRWIVWSFEYLDPYTQIIESKTESTLIIWKCDRGISFRWSVLKKKENVIRVEKTNSI